MSGGTHVRGVALSLVLLLTGACAQAKLNAIAPGNVLVERKVPDRLDMTLGALSIHLDQTVMLWSEDARIDVEGVVRDTVSRIRDRLNGPSSATVSISAGSFYAIPDVGIGGFTDPYTGNVRISMDQRSDEPLSRMLKTWLPVTMAHELHHSRRITDGPGYGSTLLDALVSEGSAEAFVRELFPAAPPIPWVFRMSLKEERAAWGAAQKELNVVNDVTVHQRWFFGGEGLPRWAGYKIGYRMAMSYLKRHPEKTASDLALLPSSDIYRGSNYDPGR